jgi:MGT family glycosyltransferase
MARFLVYTSPARGHLYPIMPTLVELKRREHEVHVRTLESEIPHLLALGINAAPIHPEIEASPLDDWKQPSFESAIGSIFETFTGRVSHEIPDLQQAMAEVTPDVLLVDITTPGAAAVAEASGLPWARWMPYLQHATFDPSAPTALGYVPFTMAPQGLDVLNHARSAVGLPALTANDDLYRAPVNLYFTAPPLEIEDLQFPDSFQLVGPGVWEPPAPRPEWLDSLPDPVVLVTASSERQGDDDLVRTALEGLGSEDLCLVVTTAAHDPGGFSRPNGAIVEQWLPHAQLLSRASCVVCHGGMGVTQKALAAGVPVCVVPFGRDQFEVAQRVAAAGAGTVLMPDQFGPDALRDAVLEAITVRAGAARVAEGFARAGGAPAAADALEVMLRAPVS